MSTDDITKGIEELRDTGRITPRAAREAISNPLEGEKFILIDRISVAVFGDTRQDPPGQNRGLLKDVHDLKIMVYQAKWSIIAAVTIATLLLTILGLVIAAIAAYRTH